MSKELSIVTELLELGEDGDFSIDITTVKKRKLETKTVSIYMESGIYKDMVNRPFIFILLPFFSPNKQRNINLIYEIENAGIKFSSSLSSDTLEEFTNKQPGEFEKNVLDFIMWKFQNKLENEEKKDICEIDFTVDEIIEYLGLSFHASYYKKVEESLFNLQETTYKIKIRNHKKAGNIIREVYERPLNLVRYRKIREKNLNGGKERVRYQVELDRRLIEEIKIKHYSIFDKELLADLRGKNRLAERIYQFISMKRFTNTSGMFRLETLAAIVPLSLSAIIRKTNKDGEEKEYKVSKKKNVLKKLEKAFTDLVELGYLLEYEVIELKEEKSYKLKYEFNPEKDNRLHKSSYLTGEKTIENQEQSTEELENNEVENREMQEIEEAESTEIQELESNVFNENIKIWQQKFKLSKEDIKDIETILKELIDEYGEERIIEVIDKINLDDIMNFEGKLRDILEKSGEIEEAQIVEEELFIPRDEMSVFQNLYSSFSDDKRKEIDKISLEIYKKELERELLIDDVINYEKENIKMIYIRKAIKELIGI